MLSHQFAIFRCDQSCHVACQSSERSRDTYGVASRSEAIQRPLTEADAIDIWIARWLRIRRKDLLIRYGCDPRRLYEIWEEKRFAGSRAKALAVFNERHPRLADRIDFGLHRRIPKAIPPEMQPGLFDA